MENIDGEDENDPDYNVMADVDQETPTKEDIIEETRVDKAVKVSKKEVKELVNDGLDFLETDEENPSSNSLKQAMFEAKILAENAIDIPIPDPLPDSQPCALIAPIPFGNVSSELYNNA